MANVDENLVVFGGYQVCGISRMIVTKMQVPENKVPI
jgi:hypothetical protein